MSENIKLKRVIRKYGIVGYGLYNFVLEVITKGITTNEPLPVLKHTSQDIADIFNIQENLVTEVVLYMIKNQLFESESGIVTCSKLYKYFDLGQTKSPAMRALISSYKGVERRVEISSESRGTSMDNPVTSMETLGKPRKVMIEEEEDVEIKKEFVNHKTSMEIHGQSELEDDLWGNDPKEVAKYAESLKAPTSQPIKPATKKKPVTTKSDEERELFGIYWEGLIKVSGIALSSHQQQVQAKACWELVERTKAQFPNDLVDSSLSILQAFYELKKSDKTNSGFWRMQSLLPTTLMGITVWSQVIESMRTHAVNETEYEKNTRLELEALVNKIQKENQAV